MTYTSWEYLSVRFSFKNRARYQEFSYLMVDGDTLKPDWDESLVSTLHELLGSVGRDGWELITHTTTSAGHYMHFKKPLAKDKSANPSNVELLEADNS